MVQDGMEIRAFLKGHFVKKLHSSKTNLVQQAKKSAKYKHKKAIQGILSATKYVRKPDPDHFGLKMG